MLKRSIAFFIDLFIVALVVTACMEPFYPAVERIYTEDLLLDNIHNMVLVIYLIFSLIKYKQTIGMKLLNLKLKTECCILKVVIIRIILIPLYILNVFYFLIKGTLFQDDLSDSTVE